MRIGPTVSTPWRDQFPGLAAGDDASRAVMDAASPLALPADQPVFRAGSPCEHYLLVLAGSIRAQVIGAGGCEAVCLRWLTQQAIAKRVRYL